MKKAFALFSTATISLGSLSGADYKGEVETGFLFQDMQDGETDGYAISASIFTKPIVHGGNAPNEELLFAERVGVLDLAYGETDTSFGALAGFEDERKSFGATYTHRQSSSRHGFEFSWNNEESDVTIPSINLGNIFGSSVPIEFEIEFEAIGGGYFYYMDDGFILGVDVLHTEISGNGAGQISAGDGEFWIYGVSARRLFELLNDKWFVVEGGLNWVDTQTSDHIAISLDGIYYFSRETGLSLGVATTDEFDDATIKAGLAHYFKDNFAVEVSISNNDRIEEYGIGGKLRF